VFAVATYRIVSINCIASLCAMKKRNKK